jgi:hypothetical protein
VTGFSPAWLALREPADHRFVNANVRQQLVHHVGSRSPISVVDLGCGTGSNLRGLAPFLAREQRWKLVDHDSRLIHAAAMRLRGWADSAADTGRGLKLERGPTTISVSFCESDLSNGDLGRILEGSNLVTGAALFDLLSHRVIDRLAATVAAIGQVFYTVLTYNGSATWLPAHPADAAMRAAFNHHQCGDKGFGPSAGPTAAEVLATAFARHGYTVTCGKSPWVLDRSFEALRRQLDQGWATAVRETGCVPQPLVDQWLQHRMAAPAAVTIVGHDDLLALPPLAKGG